MTTRPQFNRNMSSRTFADFYWYKEELQSICHQYGLPAYGTKAELTKYIVAFLNGKAAAEIKPVRQLKRKTASKLTAESITLDTKLLDSGFSLNQAARTFFANYFGVEYFNFRKVMGIKMREVEKDGDVSATVADLVKVLKDPRLISFDNEEEKTYQWNSFVKAFRRDSISKKYHEPMKVAAIIWQILKKSDHPKVYTRKLVIENAELIKEFRK
ncbi:SAP domain-containing protein [Lactiplantibacillus plantarum]|uniref:SAP domain-containing protein n=1 Tax=Lactiplantibacillus plantarum TaxID=1590 RepID=UPI000A205E3B|nr:SAP domain-containing protein [Lactiplantibacillus plantarum]ARO02347.1 hypothetical protein BIZ31_15515 [Lactiplantibacillus plantarum]ARO05329.1 hypothetical protein BIZ32_15725 [Lactiplantibacillus plantarum]